MSSHRIQWSAIRIGVENECCRSGTKIAELCDWNIGKGEFPEVRTQLWIWRSRLAVSISR